MDKYLKFSDPKKKIINLSSIEFPLINLVSHTVLGYILPLIIFYLIIPLPFLVTNEYTTELLGNRINDLYIYIQAGCFFMNIFMFFVFWKKSFDFKVCITECLAGMAVFLLFFSFVSFIIVCIDQWVSISKFDGFKIGNNCKIIEVFDQEVLPFNEEISGSPMNGFMNYQGLMIEYEYEGNIEKGYAGRQNLWDDKLRVEEEKLRIRTYDKEENNQPYKFYMNFSNSKFDKQLDKGDKGLIYEKCIVRKDKYEGINIVQDYNMSQDYGETQKIYIACAFVVVISTNMAITFSPGKNYKTISIGETQRFYTLFLDYREKKYEAVQQYDVKCKRGQKLDMQFKKYVKMNETISLNGQKGKVLRAIQLNYRFAMILRAMKQKNIRYRSDVYTEIIETMGLNEEKKLQENQITLSIGEDES